MVLKLKNRKQNTRKKVLIYGLDGSGKSTFATNYCITNGLSPICIDIDDTNFTDIPILDLKFSGDLQTYNSIKYVIAEIEKSSEYDTIILDGVTSLLEMLTSKSKGMAAYSDRSKRWNDILHKLNNCSKHLIFIGQIDMEMLFTEDYQPSKAVIHVNSIVNEKYKTFIDNQGNYCHEAMKCRTFDELEASAKVEAEKVEDKAKAKAEEITFVTPKDIAESIIAELDNKTITFAKIELKKLLDKGIIGHDECPEILKELEALL